MHKLTKIALKAIQRYSPAIKSKLALALSCSEGTINRYIRENHPSLTKAAALRVIMEVTGLRKEEILEKRKKEIREKDFNFSNEMPDYAIVEMSFHFTFKKG
jgi:hypothetical protein